MQAPGTTFVPTVDRRHARMLLPGAYGAVLLLVIWWFRYLPLADFNEWAYQAFITRTLLDGTGSAVFYLRDYPVPYITSQVWMTGLNFFMSPVAAARCTVTAYLVVAAWVAYRFVEANRLRPELAYPALLVCIVCNSSFWSGYLNYQCGLLVLMAYLSLPDDRQRDPRVVCAVSLLAFACHGFCLLAFGVLSGMQALYRSRRAVLHQVIAMVPAGMLTLWYLLAKSNDAMPALHTPVSYGDVRFLAYKFYTLSKAGPYQNFMIGDLSDLGRLPSLFWLGCAANLAAAVVLLRMQVLALKRPAVAHHAALRAVAVVLGAAYLLVPATALQIVNPGERLLYPQLLVVFVLTLRRPDEGGLPARRRWAPVAASMAVGVALLSLVNLMGSTEAQGYRGVSADTFQSAQQGYAERFYWHRPYQFIAMQDHMVERYTQGRAPEMPITFTTSLIGMHPVARPTPPTP